MEALGRETLVDRAAATILEKILSERLREGDALPSTGQLATDLDVSVVVVREALATLAGRGIVRRQQGRESVVGRPGTRILDSIFRLRTQQDSISPEEFQQCRAALEVQAASLAASNGSRESRASALEPLAAELKAARQLEPLTELDRNFHLVIAELSGNRAVALLLSSMNSVLRESIHHHWEVLLESNLGELEHALEIHADIAEAIVAGERRQAAIAMLAHFSYSGPDFGLGDINEDGAVPNLS